MVVGCFQIYNNSALRGTQLYAIYRSINHRTPPLISDLFYDLIINFFLLSLASIRAQVDIKHSMCHRHGRVPPRKLCIKINFASASQQDVLSISSRKGGDCNFSAVNVTSIKSKKLDNLLRIRIELQESDKAARIRSFQTNVSIVVSCFLFEEYRLMYL